MNKEQIKVASKQLKAASDPSRLQVLDLLAEEKLLVKQLIPRVKKGGKRIEESLLSHHFASLKEAELVKAKRIGKTVQYSITPKGRKILKSIK